MRILHVISSLSRRMGGPQSALLSLAPYQARAGLDVSICSAAEHRTTLEENGVKYNLFTSMPPLTASYTMFKWLSESLGKFDVVHIHGLYRFPVTCAAALARRAGVPYVIKPHGSLDPYLYRQSSFSLPLKRAYERLFDIPNLNHAAAIQYVTEEEARRASFLGLRARPVIVSTGIDWELYRLLPSKGTFMKRLGLNKLTPLVLFLGRINFKKGLDLLVPAFAKVSEQCPSARLAIAGPDNEGYGAKVKNWCYEYGINDRVTFVDHLGPEQVKEAYVDADVFVLPSYTENFGLTVVEAMACGCPVIISDQVNIWREVQTAGAGIVTGLDSKEISEAIVRLLENRTEAKQMGALGRLVAEKNYAWAGIIDRMTDVYSNLARSGRVEALRTSPTRLAPDPLPVPDQGTDQGDPFVPSCR